ncbi:MAG TPA: ATP-binding protein [Oligoflexus sp.]|uniref:ATP-binding protein n=1 Tax=Oligoflexus sp. TaxID=1971216 RepID=UPI002D3014AC|nr:ATP-binding protein [Oligoflexus sp.]HYX31579.1 ATP-binding protein [Oligoflexus sp.]
MTVKSRSLVYRLTAAITVVLLVCIAAISYLCFQVAAESMEGAAVRNLRQMAAMTASDLDKWIVAQEGALKASTSLATYLGADGKERQVLEPIVRNSLKAILRSSPVFVADVALLDADFKVTMPHKEGLGVVEREEAALRRPEGSGRHLMNLVFSANQNPNLFDLYRPIFTDEALLGFLLVSYRKTVIDHMLMRSALHVEKTSPLQALLVDDKNQIIRHLSLDGSGLVAEQDCGRACTYPPWSAMEMSEMLEVSESLPFSKWQVHFTQPRQVVVSSLHRKIKPWFLAVLLFTAAILYLSHLAVKRTIRPLNGLTARVQHTLDDGHALNAADKKDEVETLAQAFDDLSERLDRTLQELRLARDHAESANRIKSEFLAHMSHEIRTPLTAIVGFSELMKEANPSGQIIERNARHLLALVNDILDFSKIEAQELHLQAEIFEPVAMALEVLESLQAKAGGKHVSLSLNVEGVPAPLSIRADPVRFKQVLINLIDNGIKYTEQGQVQASLTLAPRSDTQGQLTCVITDTGIGMSEHEIHKLFLPFSQLDGRSNKTPGTGLGLAICRRLAQLMDGDITCESKLGAGSRFIWSMQVSFSCERSLPAVPVPTPLGTSPHGKANILVAEDALDSQELLRWVLERAGATVTIVGNGREAIEQAIVHETHDAFDLVLMDIGMPIINGYEATAELRRRGYKRPILALTAHATSVDRDRCSTAGCNDYLTKPIDRLTLLRKINSYMPDFRALS